MRVVGLDVCKDRVVACLLTEIPEDVREFHLEYEFPTYPLTWAGFTALLEGLKPDEVVYEPTGVAYSRVWVTRLNEVEVITNAVDHARLRGYRKGLGLPDKDDPADALALACYRLDPMKKGRLSFLRRREPNIQEIRSLVLRMQNFDRIKGAICNRLKQDLAMAFPEEQNKSIDNAPLFWGWVAGERKSVKYDLALEASIGLGITDETRFQATTLTAYLRQEMIVLNKVRALVQLDPNYEPYLRVFKQYGFGEKQSALLLSQVYPLSDFLKDGKPEVRIRKNRKSNKRSTRYLSERRFQKALGVAPVREWSGDMKKSTKGGSALCRKAIWQWIYTRIETLEKRCTNSKVNEFREIWKVVAANFEAKPDAELEGRLKLKPGKAKGVKRRLARAYLSRVMAQRLFRDLVKAIYPE